MLMIVASQCVPKHKNPEEASVSNQMGGEGVVGNLLFTFFIFILVSVSFASQTLACILEPP